MNDGFSRRICTVTGEDLPYMKNRVTVSGTRFTWDICYMFTCAVAGSRLLC